MDPTLSQAAAGLRARMESLDLLANNLANASTAGYKVDRESATLFRSMYATEDTSLMPELERNWTDFSQGLLQTTGNPLDVALSGEGFFEVQGPGGPLYTRSGNFQVNREGALVTQDGYPVAGQSGESIQLQANQAITIDGDGVIRQAGEVRGQLKLVRFAKPENLSKQGQTNFKYDGPAEEMEKADAEVLQGKTEGSNVGPAESAVRLVSVMRQFEMLQKAVSVTSEMGRKAVEDLARVG